MTLAVLDAPRVTMPRRPSEHKRDDVVVKIARDVVDKAWFVAKRRPKPDGKRLPLAEYLSDLLRPLVEADYLREYEKMQDEVKQLRRKS